MLAATPLSRAGYTMGKALSNLAVLASMVAVVIVCSALLQWVRAEDARIDPLALVMPHLLITLPFMALVAALAVLFEMLPGLRGGLGNVAWFFLWAFGGVMAATGDADPAAQRSDGHGRHHARHRRGHAPRVPGRAHHRGAGLDGHPDPRQRGHARWCRSPTRASTGRPT